jgi:hypothetical protein
VNERANDQLVYLIMLGVLFPKDIYRKKRNVNNMMKITRDLSRMNALLVTFTPKLRIEVNRSNPLKENLERGRIIYL